MNLKLKLILGLILFALGLQMAVSAFAAFIPNMAMPFQIVVAFILCIAGLWLMKKK